jgi:hypothetical protein
MKSLLFGIGLLTVFSYSSEAIAQDMDFDESEDKKKKNKRTAKKVDIDRDVREIERGLYSKANAGAMIYVLNHPSPFTAPVHSLALSIGDDFVDREKTSMAWEVSFLQTVHNGASYLDQVGNLPPNHYIQGDTRGFALLAAYEFSKYPTRRLGLGFRLAAGVMGMPVLMHEDTYNTLVVGNTWQLGVSPNHNKVYIPVGGGPSLEYYTKLAHFSIGVDSDVLYILNYDLGINITGYMKYTF